MIYKYRMQVEEKGDQVIVSTEEQSEPNHQSENENDQNKKPTSAATEEPATNKSLDQSLKSEETKQT